MKLGRNRFNGIVTVSPDTVSQTLSYICSKIQNSASSLKHPIDRKGCSHIRIFSVYAVNWQILQLLEPSPMLSLKPFVNWNGSNIYKVKRYLENEI